MSCVMTDVYFYSAVISHFLTKIFSKTQNNAMANEKLKHVGVRIDLFLLLLIRRLAGITLWYAPVGQWATCICEDPTCKIQRDVHVCELLGSEKGTNLTTVFRCIQCHVVDITSEYRMHQRKKSCPSCFIFPCPVEFSFRTYTHILIHLAHFVKYG